MLRKLTIFIFWINILTYSQQTWIKVIDINSWPKVLVKTNGSCFLVTGEAYDSRHMFLSKINLESNTVWEKIYYYSKVWGSSICQTSKNQYLIVGATASPIDSFTQAVCISKFDSSGNFLWSKPYTLLGVGSNATSIQSLENNNYMVAFTDTWAPNFGYESIGVMKIKDDGDTLWTKHLDNGTSGRIYKLSNGGYAILYQTALVDIQTSGFALAILDSSGNISGRKIFNEFPGVDANSLIVNDDNSLTICACNNSLEKIFIIQATPDGEVLNLNEYDGRTDYNVSPLITTNTGDYILVGFKNRNLILYRISKDGNIIWKKYLNGYPESCGGNILPTEDGGYLVSGYIFNENDQLYHTILVKTDSLGSNLSEVPTEMDEVKIINKSFSLSQNYPNPFNPSTTISYQLPVSSNVSLKVFNTLGQEVETLIKGFQNAGFHSSLFTLSSSLPSGIYFYKLQAGDYISVKKMILLK
jgi:hypothetical protein